MTNESTNVTVDGDVAGIDDEILERAAEELGKTAHEVARILVEGQAIAGMISVSLFFLTIVLSILGGFIVYKIMESFDYEPDFSAAECVIGGITTSVICFPLIGLVLRIMHSPLMRLFAPEYMAVKDVIDMLPF